MVSARAKSAAPPRSKIRDDRKFHSYTSKDNSTVFFATRPLVRTQVPVSTSSTAGNVHVGDAGTSSSSCSRRRPSYFAKMRKNYVPAAAASGSTATSTNSNKPTSTTRVAHLLSHEHLRVKKAKAIIGRPPPPVLSSKTSGGCDAAAAKPPPRIVQLSASPDVDEPARGKLKTANASDPEIAAELRITSPAYEGDASLQLSHLQYSAFHNRYRCGSVDRAQKDPARPQFPQVQVDVDQDTDGAGVNIAMNNTKIIPDCVDDKCLQLDRALGRAATSAAKRVWGDDEDRNAGNGAAPAEFGEVEGGCGSAPASCMKRVDAALDQAAVSAEAAVWGGGAASSSPRRSPSSCMQRVDAALDRVAVAAEAAVWGTTVEATRVESDVATKTERKESASSESGDQWQRVNASGLTTTTSTTSCFENMSSRILTNLSSPCRGGATTAGASGGPATTTSEEVEVESNLESDRLSSKASSTVSGMLAKLSAGPPKMAWTDETAAGYSGLSRGGGVFLTTNEPEDERDDIQCGSGLRDRDLTTALSGKPDEEGATTAKSPRGASPEDSSPYVARTKANGPKNTRTVLVPAYVPSPHQPRSPRTSPPSSPTNKGQSTAKTMKSSAAPSHAHQQQLHEQEPSRGKSPLITSSQKAAASSATNTSIGMQPDVSRKMSRVEQIMELRSAGGKTTNYLADVMLQRSAARNRLPSPLLREPATTNGGLFHFHDGRIKQWSPSSRSPAREQLVSSPASEHWSVSQVSSGVGQQLSAADGKRKAMPMRGGSHQQERHCQSARGLNPNDWWGDYEGISNGPLRVGLRQAEWTRRREEKKLRLSEDLISDQCTPSDDFIAHQSRSSAGRYRYISPRVYDEKRKGGFLRNAISASPNPKSRAGRSSGKSSSRKLKLEVKIRNGTCLYARGKAAMDQKEFRRSTLLAERALLETSSCTFQPDIFVSQLHEKERENAKILARAVRNWKTAKGGGTGVGSSVSRSASANASFRAQEQQIKNISAATEISRRSGAGAGDHHLTRTVSLNMARQPGTPLVIPAVPTVAMADARSSSTPFFSAQSTLSTSSTKGALPLRVVSPSLKTSDAPAKLPGSSGGPSTATTRPTDTTATLSTGKSFSFYPGSRNASVPVTDRSAGTTSASLATTDGGLAGAKTKTRRLIAGPTSSGPVATPRGARAVQIFRDQRNALIKPIPGGGSFACRINLAGGGAAGAGDTVGSVRTTGARGMGNKQGTGTSSCSDKKTKTRVSSSSTARSDSLAFVSAHSDSATAGVTATDAGGSGASASTSHGRNQDASVVKHDHQESLRESHEVLTKLKSLLVAKPRPTLTTSSSSSRMGGSSSFASTSHQFWTPQERRSASQKMRNSSRGPQRASVQRSARSASPLPRNQQELTADNLPHFATPIKRTPRARIASEAEAVVVQRKARPARGAGGGRRKKRRSAEHQGQNGAQADTEKSEEKGRAHAKEESVADTAAGAAAGASQRQSQDRPRSSRGPRRGEDTDTMLGKMLEIFDSPWRKTNAAGGTAEGGPPRAGRASGSGRPITALFFSDPPTTTTRASGSAGAADGKNKKKKVAASPRLNAAPTSSIYVSPAESALHAGSTATSSSAKMANTLVLDGCCEANHEPDPRPRRNSSEPEDGRGDVMSYQDPRAIAAQHHVWVPSTSAELLYSNRSGAELQVNMNTATLSTTGNTSRSGSGAPMKRSPSPPSVQEILGESIDDIEERISRRSSLNMPNNGGSFEQENSVD
mmetsp:Transcript_8480/g.20424  ORF Transcript_8480/g.20424 Transcript_8480/m.20424 type:complete len:1745 (-) Transcript_8480:577-5811(-)